MLLANPSHVTDPWLAIVLVPLIFEIGIDLVLVDRFGARVTGGWTSLLMLNLTTWWLLTVMLGAAVGIGVPWRLAVVVLELAVVATEAAFLRMATDPAGTRPAWGQPREFVRYRMLPGQAALAISLLGNEVSFVLGELLHGLR